MFLYCIKLFLPWGKNKTFIIRTPRINEISQYAIYHIFRGCMGISYVNMLLGELTTARTLKVVRSASDPLSNHTQAQIF